MKKIIIFAMSIMALAACSKQHSSELLNLDEILFNILMPASMAATKATATAFENGDALWSTTAKPRCLFRLAEISSITRS